MLIAITERNMWENESWTYVVDGDKQDAASINFLITFSVLANKKFEEDKQQANRNGHPRCFASSCYNIRFFDSFEDRGGGRISLKNKGMNLIIGNGDSSYTSFGLRLDRVISNAKIKSAMVHLRDKNNNKLYKEFESVFLKKK